MIYNSVLIICSEYPPGPGGIGYHAYSLSKALVKRGWDVTVLTPGDYATRDEIQFFDTAQSFRILRFPRTGKISTYFTRLDITFRVVRAQQFNRIILTGKFSLWQGLLIKFRFPGVKTLAVLHGSEVNLSNRILRSLTHRSISAADIITPVSGFTCSLIPEWIRKQHDKIVIIPNGIDNEWIHESDINISLLKGYPALLTVGHVSPRKGQHRVIKALPTLIKTYPNIHYHIVGLPHHKDQFQTLACELGVEEHLTFHGRLTKHTDLAHYYNSADVFMLLSENQPDGDVEGFGIVALEANLHGLPVVGARQCGVEEAVSHLKSGYLVDGNDSNQILEGVKYCLENSQILSVLSKEWARKHHWSEIVNTYIGLLE